MRLFVFGWQGGTDIQMYNAHCSYRLKGGIQFPDPLIASKWIQLLDPLPALLCTTTHGLTDLSQSSQGKCHQAAVETEPRQKFGPSDY